MPAAVRGVQMKHAYFLLVRKRKKPSCCPSWLHGQHPDLNECNKLILYSSLVRESLSGQSYEIVCIFNHMLMCFAGWEMKALLLDARDTGNSTGREKGVLGSIWKHSVSALNILMEALGLGLPLQGRLLPGVLVKAWNGVKQEDVHPRSDYLTVLLSVKSEKLMCS